MLIRRFCREIKNGFGVGCIQMVCRLIEYLFFGGEREDDVCLFIRLMGRVGK